MQKRNYYVAAIVVVLAILGILFAAAKSAPESALYSVRTNVTEKAIGMTKTGDLAKANYALQLGDTRLQELQSLKDKKILDSKVGNSVRDDFNQQTIIVQNSINNLSKKEGANAHDVLQLSETLDVYIEQAKAIFNIDQLEVLPEGAPVPKATSTKVK